MCYQFALMAAMTAATTAEARYEADKQRTQQKRAMRQQQAQFETLLSAQEEAPEDEAAEAVDIMSRSQGLTEARRILAATKAGTVATSPLGTQWRPGAKKTLLGA